ncbi:MAG: hypothetical protein NT011_05490 [Kiritimatiellaeota bacterium]|nr:hypothetical protein [Kiritimatiellota bacterium]
MTILVRMKILRILLKLTVLCFFIGFGYFNPNIAEAGNMTNNGIKIDIQSPYSVTLNLDLEPSGGPWGALRPEKNKISVENDIYSLILNKTALEADVTGLEYILRRKDGTPFLLKRIEAAVDVSAGNVQNIITPYGYMHATQCITPYEHWHWGFKDFALASSGDPVITVLDHGQNNKCTVGMAWTAPETYIEAKPLPGSNSEWNRKYRVSLTRPRFPMNLEAPPVQVSEYRDGIFISTKPETWFRTMRRYAAYVDQRRGYKPRKLSPWSLSPCWSIAWTLWSPPELKKGGKGWMQKILESQAPLAKEMGFDVIHLEADSLQWDLYHEPSKTAFSDFKGTLKKLNDLGMILEMHFSTPCLPKGAPDYDNFKAYAVATLSEPAAVADDTRLCPRTQGMQQRLVECVQHMVRDMGVKSFWVDFCDDKVPLEPCIAKHEHAWNTLGEGWDAQMQAYTEAAWKIDPEVTFLARRSIASLNNKPYLTHGCAFDCEYSLALNRHDAVYIRSLGDVIPFTFHGIWPDSESDQGVAMQMANCTFLMVPVVCQELARLSQGHRDVIKAWLSFYKIHASDLILGDFEPLTFSLSGPFRIESKGKAFIGCFEVVPGTVPLTTQPSEIWVLNTVAKDFFTRLTPIKGTFKAQWLDYRLRPTGPEFKVSAEDGQLLISGNCQTLPSMLHLWQ